MELFAALSASPALFAAVAAILGLIVGSFLNVVIHRLPMMLEADWRAQCRELLEIEEQEAAKPRYGLWHPRSACPRCQRPIRAIENIPVLSYLALRGRCRGCGERISWQYPAVELLCGVLSGAVAWHYGFGAQAAGALVLTWALIALSGIDIRHQLLPDNITLPILWLGLILSLWTVYVAPAASIIGAAVGYLSLWSVFQLFRLLTGKEGMGFGDFKLMAAIGAWMGWEAIPVTVILSSLVGAAVGLALIALRGHDRNIPIPFGPYIAAAGWLALLWRDDLINAYLQWSGLA